MSGGGRPLLRIRPGFTLAEVLITLGIIGVVAALTLPNLVAKYKEKQTVAAVKVAYSTFANALPQVANEYDGLDNVIDASLTNKQNASLMINALSKYIVKLKICDNLKGCMPDTYTTLDGRNIPSNNWEAYTNLQTGTLANGMTFWILAVPNSSYQLGVDINGRKGPNKIGVDFFQFAYDAHGNVLVGDNPTAPCDKSNKTALYTGYGCTYWILTEENMDYLK